MKATTGNPTEERKTGTVTGETDKLGTTQMERLKGATLDVVFVKTATLEWEGRT